MNKFYKNQLSKKLENNIKKDILNKKIQNNSTKENKLYKHLPCCENKTAKGIYKDLSCCKNKTTKENRLYKYLPYYEKKSEIFREITKVESEEFDEIDINIKDLNKQIFIDSATWAILIYEKELGLPINPEKTLEERKNIIKSKLKGLGKIDYLVIKEIVETFTKAKAKIEFDGEINIVLSENKNNITVLNIKNNLKYKNNNILDISNKEMHYYIEEVKPAHLGYKFETRTFNKIKVLSSFKNGFSKFPLCNTILCGMYPYIKTKGKIKNNKILLKHKIKNNFSLYKKVGTIRASERFYEDYKFAVGLINKSYTKILNSSIKRNINYIKAGETLAGKYPYIKNKIKIKNSKILILQKNKSNFSLYKKVGTIKASERFYEDHKFAVGLINKSYTKILNSSIKRNINYIKAGETLAGKYPYIKNKIKQINKKIIKVEKIKNNKIPYKLCGITYPVSSNK